MVRPAFVVTDGMREKVQYLAGLGVPQDDIAKIVGCAPKTLRKRFREELDRGVAEANAMVAGYLFNSAKQGNVSAQIFWLKQEGVGRRERRRTQFQRLTPGQVHRSSWSSPTTTEIPSSPRYCVTPRANILPRTKDDNLVNSGLDWMGI